MVRAISKTPTAMYEQIGIISDNQMCHHSDPEGSNIDEVPERITYIWNKLEDIGVAERCRLFRGERASTSDIRLFHSKKYVKNINLLKSMSPAKRKKKADSYKDIYFNEHSTDAAYLAAGSVIKVCDEVGRGNIRAAAAVVRPPGHHACCSEAMGFCIFNSIVIAAKYLLEHKELCIEKILVVDWDVHHGNGTQTAFYNNPKVLYFSVHRHNPKTFFPQNEDGAHTKIGGRYAKGLNINVPWRGQGYGDADYFAVWDDILLPVAKEFKPDIVLISAGFDSAEGDHIGMCSLTPYGYSILTKQLMSLASGKIVLVLEGGYNKEVTASCFASCVETLISGKEAEMPSRPFKKHQLTLSTIKKVRDVLSPYWKFFGNNARKRARTAGRIGTFLSTLRLKRKMKQHLPLGVRIHTTAAVYLGGVVRYLTEEVLDGAKKNGERVEENERAACR